MRNWRREYRRWPPSDRRGVISSAAPTDRRKAGWCRGHRRRAPWCTGVVVVVEVAGDRIFLSGHGTFVSGTRRGTGRARHPHSEGISATCTVQEAYLRRARTCGLAWATPEEPPPGRGGPRRAGSSRRVVPVRRPREAPFRTSSPRSRRRRPSGTDRTAAPGRPVAETSKPRGVPGRHHSVSTTPDTVTPAGPVTLCADRTGRRGARRATAMSPTGGPDAADATSGPYDHRHAVRRPAPAR